MWGLKNRFILISNLYLSLCLKLTGVRKFDDIDRLALENFSVGGRNCRLLYVDGKCESNDREQWITQLGFHWEYLIEEFYYSCGISTSSGQSSMPSSFKMDILTKPVYQTMSSNSLMSIGIDQFSENSGSKDFD